MTGSATSRTNGAAAGNALGVARPTPVAAAGRIQLFAVMAQRATGRTVPQ